MNLPKLPDDAVNKSLADLIYRDMVETCDCIGWDFRSLLGAPIQVTMGPCRTSPDTVILATVTIKTNKGLKELHCRAEISHTAVLAYEAEDVLKMISLEAKQMARQLINGVVEEFGSTYAEEKDRYYKDKKEKAEFMFSKDISVPRTDIDPNEDTLRSAITRRQQNAKWTLE